MNTPTQELGLLMYSCRDKDKPHNNVRTWREGTITRSEWIYGVPRDDIYNPEAPKSEHAAVFIHGYNNTVTDCHSAYMELSRNLRASMPSDHKYDIYGWTWPSEGSAFRFYSDRQHIRKSRPATKKFLEMLGKSYKTVTIIAHSMGSILACDVAFETSGLVRNVILHAGEAPLRKFRLKGKYGKVSSNVNELTSLYSKYDAALKFAEWIPGIWLRRIGRHWIPKAINPINFGYIDVSYLANDGKTGHNDYKSSSDIAEVTNANIG